MNRSEKWRLELTPRFRKDYRKLSKDLRTRVKDKIILLMTSENPRELGHIDFMENGLTATR